MNTGQNPILKKTDISFSEQRVDTTLHFFKNMYTELKLRRNVHVERYKRNNYHYLN